MTSSEIPAGTSLGQGILQSAIVAAGVGGWLFVTGMSYTEARFQAFGLPPLTITYDYATYAVVGLVHQAMTILGFLVIAGIAILLARLMSLDRLHAELTDFSFLFTLFFLAVVVEVVSESAAAATDIGLTSRASRVGVEFTIAVAIIGFLILTHYKRALVDRLKPTTPLRTLFLIVVMLLAASFQTSLEGEDAAFDQMEKRVDFWKVNMSVSGPTGVTNDEYFLVAYDEGTYYLRSLANPLLKPVTLVHDSTVLSATIRKVDGSPNNAPGANP